MFQDMANTIADRNAEANNNSDYPNGWWFYWCLRTADVYPYTLSEAVAYMQDEDGTFSADWQDMTPEKVRQMEQRYMRRRHPSSGR